VSARAPAAATVLLAGVVALAIASDRDDLARSVVPALARTELGELDRLAGLREDDGQRTGSEALPVGVRADGPPWIAESIADIVAADDAYAVRGGPHAIVGELVVVPTAVALRLSLERRGWLLHAPAMRRRLQPALAVVPAVVGIATWAWTRRVAIGIVIAGVLAQLVLASWPWPVELVAPRGGSELASGPLGALVLAVARRMDRVGIAVAGGVIAASTVLAMFEHRRSRGRGGPALVVGVLGVLGAIAWIEAAGRASVGAWATTPGGAIAALLAVAAIVVLRRSVRMVEAPS